MASRGLRRRVAGLFCGGAVAALMLGAQAHAAGFYLEDQSTKGSGRAFSGEASDFGPESIFYNPASIAGLIGLAFSSSATAVLVQAKVTDVGSIIQRPGQTPTSVGGDPRVFKPVEPGLIPSGAIAYGGLPYNLSVGLSFTSPFSFATKYDAMAFTRYTADTTRLTTIDVQPTLAWRPVRWLGVGAGPVIEHSNAVFSNASPQLIAGLPDGYEYLSGAGWNVGYAFGAQIRPSDQVTVGLSYRSKIDHTLDGNVTVSGLLGPLAAANFATSAQARFTTPWTATFGVRWQVTDRLALEGQGVRFGWSEFSQIALSSAAPLPSVPENYHDTTSGALGLDFAVTPKWTVRAGAQYDPTPTPDVNRDARVPDADRYLFAFGSSYRFTPHVVVDAAISYVDFQHTRINRDATAYGGTAAVTPISIQGDVEASAVTMSLGSRLTF